MRMMRPLCVWAAACLIAAVACGPKNDGGTAMPAPAPIAESEAEEPTKPVGLDLPRAEFPGVAHSANIDAVAMCPTGTCAASRDTLGGVRLWTALDGSAEPQPVPLTSVRTMAVAKRGDAYLVFGIEGSSGARLISMRPDGSSREGFALPPFEPVQHVALAPGGERAIVLMKDGSIRVYDPKGTLLTTFDEKRFQPYSVRVSADGKHLLALLRMERSGDFRVEVQRLSFGGTDEAPTLARSGVPHIVRSTFAIEDTSIALAPDASEVAVVGRAKNDGWIVDRFDLASDADPTPLEVKVTQSAQPRIGFVGPERLLVSSNEGTLSWLIDTKTGDLRPRTSAPQDFNHQGRAQWIGAQRQVMGYGNFLFVHDVDTRKHRFLGYGATQGAGVGLSPSGEHVAWAYVQGPVVVERLDGTGEPISIDFGNNNFHTTRVRFLDEDHVVIVDSAGEATLVHWASGTVLARAGVMGNVRNVWVDPEQGLLVIDRHNNEVWVYEASVEKGFEGPYIVADEAYRLGLLRPTPPSELVLWTLDSKNTMRQYTLDELRSDLTAAQSEAMGKAMEAGKPAPLAIDHLGRHYGVRWNGTNLEMFIDHDGKTVASKSVPSSDVNQVLPSPTGDRFLAVLNRGGTVSVSMHDSTTMEPLWSYATGVFNNDTSWSADGRYVGLAANTGAVLLDSATGKPVRKRCGLAFQALSAPPQNAFSSPNQRSLCDL
ncbi:MAG: hypothetical protein AAGA54_04495 [Myxococcota bacterium]